MYFVIIEDADQTTVAATDFIVMNDNIVGSSTPNRDFILIEHELLPWARSTAHNETSWHCSMSFAGLVLIKS